MIDLSMSARCNASALLSITLPRKRDDICTKGAWPTFDP